MRALGMRTARPLLMLPMLLTCCAAITASAASGYAAEDAEPVPTGAELAERCAEYREDLAFTRAQLKARNVLGRWDFIVGEHRERERFVAEHCADAARSGSADDGDQAMLDAAVAHAPGLRQS